MTLLSRLELEPRNLAVARDLGDLAEMHRTIMRAFPATEEAQPRAAFGVLFRVESESALRLVLVQSQVRPDWSLLPDGYLRKSECKHIDNALDAIETGRELRFLLIANPSRKVASFRPGEAPPKNSRRVELTTDDARHRWLADRGTRDGFALNGSGPHDGIRIDRVVAPPRTRAKRRAEITVKRVRYEGRLVVADAERFVEAIGRGIGPAKAYGCGLLSVAPAY